MKKAVFFDIDGTLWNHHCEIQPSTKAAIKALRERGHLAFICSGRSRSNIQNEELLGLGFDGVVASCGMHIDFHKEVVFETLLTEEQVGHALAVVKKHHLPVVLEGPQHIYVNEGDFLEDPYVIHLRKELGERLREIPESPNGVIINKLSALTKDVDVEALGRDLGEEFDMIVHEDGILEIHLSGHSKASGIQRVCDMLDISLEDTYAFGDSENDLEMLAYVGHGIAMGNGTEKVKQVSEYVTTGVEEDGIYNGLKYYGLI